MENASKALLIAASVLVAILLIAFAVKTINSTSGINESQQETMQTAEMSQFNSKFTQYIGSNKSRAQVMALLNVAISNNATNTQHQVKVNGCDPTSKINSVNGSSYKISVVYDSKHQYISNIKTEPNF